MAGNKQAAAKRLATMIAKYGSEEAYHDQLRKWAGMGGKKSGGGFKSLTKEQHSEISRKGHAAMLSKAREGK